ncbi:WD40 repeat-like protein [Peniophora sp. CONT]|nr:WD40 repeat-like protein [Peniophora sp. CONT]
MASYDGGAASAATTCAFSNSSFTQKRGLIAAGTNDGMIYVLRAESAQKIQEIGRYDTSSLQNRTAVFKVQWSNDDLKIAIATGGKEAYVMDLHTETITAALHGHARSQKCIKWCPKQDWLLSTGSRDGSICVWDLRVHGGVFRDPEIQIRRAHSQPEITSSTTTVTDLLYTTEHSIYSAGAADAILKYWDLRNVKDSHEAAVSTEKSPSQMTKRSRGIQSFVDLDNGTLLALARDSSMYGYSNTTLAPTGDRITSPKLHANSAYASLSLSPCRRWISAGGAHGSGIVVNVEKIGCHGDENLRPEITHLEAEHGEVNGMSWSNSDLAMAYDDGTIRVWRSGVSNISG